MTNEQSKISTEDEARLIFDAARTNLGEPADVEQIPRRDDAAQRWILPSDDDNAVETKDNDLGDVTDDLPRITPFHRDAPVEDQVEPELATVTIRSINPSRDSDDQRIEPAVSGRLRESPREALRRLQHKAETARSEGFLE